MLRNTLLLVLLSLTVQLNANPSTPQRLVLTWEGDPATSQSISWRTVKHIKNARAQVTPVTNWARDFDDKARTVQATAQQITTEKGKDFTHYTARFTGLAPNTQYAYRVGSKRNWSEWNLFRTAGTESDPFSFIYIGDIQNDIYDMTSPLLRRMALDTPDSRFVLIAGDLVNRGKHDNEWGELFTALGFIPRMLPLVPITGNHDSSKEIRDEYGNSTPDPLFLAHFALPDNGPDDPTLQEAAYTLDYQCARIVVFNSNTWEHETQLAWLESELKANDKPWLLVSFHHPVYSTGRNRDNEDMRAVLAPLFEKYGVDLVLQGHDHCYGRTGKILQGETVAPDADAPVYVVSVSGPKMYNRNENFTHLMPVQISETQLYQVISISTDKLEYVSKSLDGQVQDAFKLLKQGNGTVLEE